MLTSLEGKALPVKINSRYRNLHFLDELPKVTRVLGGKMGFITDIFGGINWEAIAQLTMLAAIVIAGPVVIFLLAARGGDL